MHRDGRKILLLSGRTVFLLSHIKGNVDFLPIHITEKVIKKPIVDICDNLYNYKATVITHLTIDT